MPISAKDLLSLLGGKRRKTSTTGRALAGAGAGGVMLAPVAGPTSLGDVGRPAPPGVGRPTDYVPPTPVAAGLSAAGPRRELGGLSGQQWLDMALAALGGGPDRGAYVAPFDAAASRARGAHEQSLPAIAQAYAQLRGNMEATQGTMNQHADQARGAIDQRAAATQQQMQQMTAPVLADLASQGGPAIGGLMGAAQAQVGTQQAQLAQQAGTQQQLQANLAQAAQATHNSRIQDSGLAETSAKATAGNTLNQVLAQLDAKKAQALQAYAADAASHGSKVASLRMQALERDEARAEKQAALDDPARQIDLDLKRLDLEDRRMEVEDRMSAREAGAGGGNRYSTQLSDWQMRTAEKNPVAYSLLSELVTAGGKDGTPTPTVIANIRARSKGGKIDYEGKKIDANWLISRVKELDELERLAAEEEERRSTTSKRRR